ncbi:MAG: DUF4347 domain-containing protein, partial [Clostridium beijerinckii]|nr:DUF4347 domain-containing protein [Clostridium beijerinckii]
MKQVVKKFESIVAFVFVFFSLFFLTGISAHADSKILANYKSISMNPVISESDKNNEILFIDSTVKDYDIFMREVKPNVVPIILDASKDELSQIISILKNKKDIRVIHIISHGESGKVFLGNDTLSVDTLDKYSSELNIIGNSLSKNGEILLYGCDVAKGEKGVELIDRLAQKTGASVAASDNITGNIKLGGDWKLEVKKGNISDKDILSFESYLGILPRYTFQGFYIEEGWQVPSASGNYQDLTITAWDMDNSWPMPSAYEDRGYLWLSGAGLGRNGGSVHKLTIEKTNGTVLTPNSVDVSIWTYKANDASPYETDTFRVEGYNGNNLVASQTFSNVITGSTVDVDFSAFTNITRLEFSMDYNSFGIGNLIVDAPIVTGITPTTGPATGGTQVTITGTNFTNSSTVKFGALNATNVVYNSPSQITATAPAGSGTVDVVVVDRGCTSATSNSDKFTYASAATHTVTFKDYDGTVIKTETVIEGASATAPSPNPTRNGYTFVGWDKVFTNITEDTVVTARYNANSYTVTFKDYDGTVIKTETVIEGASATAPSPNPTRNGYTFAGWDKVFTNITEDTVVTAMYNANSYTVTF